MITILFNTCILNINLFKRFSVCFYWLFSLRKC
nr:MAG TPA: hypothetical protein [Caudoviricetes sp.]